MHELPSDGGGSSGGDGRGADYNDSIDTMSKGLSTGGAATCGAGYHLARCVACSTKEREAISARGNGTETVASASYALFTNSVGCIERIEDWLACKSLL